jgi:Transglutaminase-like superfamily
MIKPILTKLMLTIAMRIAAILVGFIASPAVASLEDSAELQFSSTTASALRAKADELGSALNIYEYLRNNADYSPYHGLRSGAINAFMGMRGNDVDLASAMIAMLRYRGVPARYATGTVRITAAQLQNWLNVENTNLAVSILNNQGIPNVVLSADLATVTFEHTWVEAQIPYGDYRGVGSQTSAVNCTTQPSICSWIGLDPSFKQRRYRPNRIDIYNQLNFDYTGYYNAIKNAATDPLKRKDKNPLAIYEEQVLSYLRTNYPGKTLEDVADAGTIISIEAGLLPASLPYQVIGTIRVHSNVAEHDAQVPSSEIKKWERRLKVSIYTQKVDLYGYPEFDQYDQPVRGTTLANQELFSLVDLATKQLTLTFEYRVFGCSSWCPVLRLDKVVRQIAPPTTGRQSDPLVLELALDGIDQEAPINAKYYSLNGVGGYYVIGTGGETSNWSQVHRAADQLLAANRTYATQIADYSAFSDKDAVDSLTGGLLYTAMNLYFTQFREGIAKLGLINHVNSPIEGFVGVVSSTPGVDYVGETAYGILPGGLLIDMKGQQLGGNWRTNAAATKSDKHFELIGHISSSLEHEIWQQITGFDAVSTVRGMQMALAAPGNAVVSNPKRINGVVNLETEYPKFGFQVGASTATGFAYTSIMSPFDPYNTRGYYAWRIKPELDYLCTSYGDCRLRSFDLFKRAVSSSTPTLRKGRKYYYLPFPDGGSAGRSAGSYMECYSQQSRQLYYLTTPSKTIIPTWTSCLGGTYTGFYSYCDSYDSNCGAGNANSLWHRMKTEYETSFLPAWKDRTFYDTLAGFVPSEYVYREYAVEDTQHQTGVILSIRDNLYFYTGGGLEYLIPTLRTKTAYNIFSVYIAKQWAGPGQTGLLSLSFNIQNWGGGYLEIPKEAGINPTP